MPGTILVVDKTQTMTIAKEEIKRSADNVWECLYQNFIFSKCFCKIIFSEGLFPEF